MDIASLRLQNQQLTQHSFEKPEEVVSWFGAMQAQDFAAVKWAIALRSNNQTDASIEQAFNEGKILRTHVMRPTWHFVTPQDIRWLLALTSPRVHRFNGYYYRRSGFDKTIFAKSNNVLKKALEGSKQLTRDELNRYLTEANIPTQNLGLTYTIMQAELDGIIISGPRKGKKFTYMLLEDRVPKTKPLSPDEALKELTKRYFQSHGPAQAQDFSWWSGLSISEVKRGIEMLGEKLQKEEQNDKTYWFIKTKAAPKTDTTAFLVPGFDEYFIAYHDRSGILDRQYAKQLNQGGGMVSGAVVVNGKMVGGWRRTFVGKQVKMSLTLFENISEKAQREINLQVKKFGIFFNLPVIV